MKRVYKYPLQLNDEVALDLPEGAEVLSVQEQRGGVCLWALGPPIPRPVHRRPNGKAEK